MPAPARRIFPRAFPLRFGSTARAVLMSGTRRGRIVAMPAANHLSHEPMAFLARVDAITREAEVGIFLAALGEQLVHGTVDVDHFPTGRVLRDEPLRISIQNLVVAFERLFVFV